MLKEDVVSQLPEKDNKVVQDLHKSEYTPPRLTIYGDVARMTEGFVPMGESDMPVGSG